MMQKRFYPDSTIFLGDLFDGGREWSTGQSVSPEKRFRKYGGDFWMKEYKRFAGIFFDTFIEAGTTDRNDPTKKRLLLSNLPGNHDLGFAGGIQLPVKKRFETYFGESNRIDIIGNHSFISLDTVSLSAKAEENADPLIWKPSQEFLDEYPQKLDTTVATYLATQGEAERAKFEHKAFATEELADAKLPRQHTTQADRFPSILLTHVPLYRDQGTPCGPHRERYPPSKGPDGKPMEIDRKNALPVSRGYQYQTVLSLEVSKEIASKLENLSYAFSGDDHDYCEVHHRRYPSAGGGIYEITVKSLSWASGIRIPGFQLLSLYNPTSDSIRPGHTLQSKLCLMPDQLAIFIRYAMLLVATFVLLSLRAARIAILATDEHSPTANGYGPILPVANRDHSNTASSSSSEKAGGLSARNVHSATRTRSSSPQTSMGYGLPAVNGGVLYSGEKKEKDDDGLQLYGVPFFKHGPPTTFDAATHRKPLTGFGIFRVELLKSMARVAAVVLPWYIWLIWRG
jgi:ethanolamine phosphate phosphodiesterase